ncbi:hypothetical protein [Streptomyces sp. NPDC088733]|uniref:hypothetical protein n=1 Tax=Streptomyces sp. NPDC088733 TaxID=3365880 RepID=UPI00381F25E2
MAGGAVNQMVHVQAVGALCSAFKPSELGSYARAVVGGTVAHVDPFPVGLPSGP